DPVCGPDGGAPRPGGAAPGPRSVWSGHHAAPEPGTGRCIAASCRQATRTRSAIMPAPAHSPDTTRRSATVTDYLNPTGSSRPFSAKATGPVRFTTWTEVTALNTPA